MKQVLLSTTYFGPIQWYQKLYRAECVQIEQWESFQKQTYRNRCLIATTQGVQALTVPIERLSTVNYIKDYRSAIRPKNPEADPDFESRPYYQVWQQKNGFLANLSILDLLFNMGNESVFYL